MSKVITSSTNKTKQQHGWLKAIKKALKYSLVGLVLTVLLLGFLGGGWGKKLISAKHPLYQDSPMLLAHRGAAYHVPENTLASVALAAELGYHGVEIDIKESGDQHFFLFHDRRGNRLLNRDIKVGAQSLAEIQQWPLYHQGIITEHRIPDLESFTRDLESELVLYLDLKRHGNDRYNYLADKIYRYLIRHDLVDRTFVGSDFLFISYLEWRYPDIHTVFTGPGDNSIFVYNWIPRDFRADFIIGYADEITPAHVEWLKKHDLINRRMVYGVDHTNFQQVSGWGVHKLLVDHHPEVSRYLTQ